MAKDRPLSHGRAGARAGAGEGNRTLVCSLGALDACRSCRLRKEGVALQTAVATPSYPKPAVTPVGITLPVLGIHGDICAARATLRTTSEVESAGPLALAEVCATVFNSAPMWPSRIDREAA
jgi:hypothetical protein